MSNFDYDLLQSVAQALFWAEYEENLGWPHIRDFMEEVLQANQPDPDWVFVLIQVMDITPDEIMETPEYLDAYHNGQAGE